MASTDPLASFRQSTAIQGANGSTVGTTSVAFAATTADAPTAAAAHMHTQADLDDKIGTETFIAFAFTSNTDRNVAQAGGVGGVLLLDGDRVACPVQVTLHGVDGVPMAIKFDEKVRPSPNLLSVADAASLMASIHVAIHSDFTIMETP